MIVPVTSERYDLLFSEATQLLRQAGKLSATQSIDNLNEYYAHMKDFYQLPSKAGFRYIMMPLDEDGEAPFMIDLNSRAISVPSAFVKVGAVQADQMAELIIFEVDRFFDYMDLAETHIYVQWQLPDAEHTKGATRINIIDWTTKPGKIRFAWPLNDAITAQNGTVKFSVRFFLLDDQENLAYALNTLDTNLVIKPALDPTANPDNVEQVDSLFENAILNSRYATEGVTPPVDPWFGAPGTDMDIVDTEDFVRLLSGTNEIKTTKVAKLGTDNRLVLKVQAVAGDAGNITYKWKFKADTDDAEFVDAPIDNNQATVGYELAQYPKDATGAEYLSYVDKYYTKIDEDTYERYNGTTIPDHDLYEMYNYYTITGAEGDTVVGTYAVDATNTITLNDGTVLKSHDKRSVHCYLPGPKDIEFEAEPYTLNEDDMTLVANLYSDINDPELTYTWYRSEESSADAISKATAGVENTDYDMSSGLVPGWYAVKVAAKLNLKTKTANATKSQKVCAEPTIANIDPDADKRAFPIDPKAIAPLEIIPEVDRPSTLGESAAPELYRNLSYEWFVKAPNTSTWKPIENHMMSENDDTKLIQKIESDNNHSILYARNVDEGNPYQYKCKVTNTLGSKSVSKMQSDNTEFLVY